MAAKLIAFLKAAPGLDHASFRDYYETRHVPLVLRTMPGIIDYRRNYLPDQIAGFDAVTEIWFSDRAALDAAMAIATSPPADKIIARDEEQFLDRSVTVHALVEETGGPTGEERSR